MSALTIEFLIKEVGRRTDGHCHLCKGRNLWLIEGLDQKPPAVVCSWCDVEVKRRWDGKETP